MASDPRSGRQKVQAPRAAAECKLCSISVLVSCGPAARVPRLWRRSDPRGFAQAPSKMRDGFLAVSDAPAAWEDQTQV